MITQHCQNFSFAVLLLRVYIPPTCVLNASYSSVVFPCIMQALFAAVVLAAPNNMAASLETPSERAKALFTIHTKLSIRHKATRTIIS